MKSGISLFFLVLITIFAVSCSSSMKDSSTGAITDSNSYNQDSGYSGDYGGAKSDNMASTSDSASVSDNGSVVADSAGEAENADADVAVSSENPFVSTADQPVSTFSIDVDTASYSLSRRYIMQSNMLPPADYVRIEEFINYFSYNYPEAEPGKPFSITMEMGKSPWNSEAEIIMIGLKGRTVDPSLVPNSNLTFLLDVSGSMESVDKLPLIKSAFLLLVDHLKDTDNIAIVTYAGEAGVLLESTPGSEKEKIKAAISSLGAGGSTAGAQGLITAYEIAGKQFSSDANNRVILATDGDFNVGASSDKEMEDLIVSKRESGIYLTAIGVGTGNLQDSKLETLADKGNGNYFYIDNLNEAKKVFIYNLTANLFTIAKDVKLQVEFNPAKIDKYRLIGYENRVMANNEFNDDTKDAGEIGAGHTVTAYYEVYRKAAPRFMLIDDSEINDDDTVAADSDTEVSDADAEVPDDGFVPVEFNADEIMQLRMRYKEPDSDMSTYLDHMLKEEDFLAEMSENMGFSSAVVEFAMLLRRSEFKAESSYDSVLSRAKNNMGDDEWGFKGEFLEIVAKAKGLDK